MRTGKELILATKAFAKENRTRSWVVTLSTLAMFLAAVAGTLWNVHWTAKVVSGLLAGLLMVRMFIVYHDYAHHAILRNSPLAKLILNSFAVLVMVPPSIWGESHNHHHKNNSKFVDPTIGSYPLMTLEDFRKASRGKRFKYLATRHPLTILFGYITVFFGDLSLASFIKSPKEHWDGLVSVLIHGGLIALLIIFGGVEQWVYTLVIPYFTGMGLGAYLFYAQHNYPNVQFNYDIKEWSYEFAALKSSSYMGMPRIMHWFTGNIGFHHIHHLNPSIPFYNLRQAMKAIPELQKKPDTNLSPIEVYRCLQLKVYDPAVKRMVSV